MMRIACARGFNKGFLIPEAMGDLLSTLTASAEDIAAIQSNSTKSNQSQPTHQRQSPESRTLSHETSDPPTDSKTAGIHENPVETKTLIGKQPEESANDGDGGAEEEEEEGEEAGECGFCLFMKAGGCKEAFIEWDNCMEEAKKKEEDVAEKCFKATSALKKCMEANSDYYAPILLAEKSMDEAVKKLKEEKEKEKEKLNVEGGGSSQISAEKEKEGALGGNDSKNQSLIT